MPSPPNALAYPITKRLAVQDDYHGVAVPDPYRWLEDDTAPEVEAWVKQQNEVTFGYLKQIPYRQAIADRYRQLFDFPKLSAPQRMGRYYLFYKNDGLQNQPVIYIQEGLDGHPEVLIDPNELSPDGTVAVSLSGSSKDGRYLAVFFSEAGSDWQKIRVMELSTRQWLDDEIHWVKFSGAYWSGHGFFYSRYPEPKKGDEYSGKNVDHSVYYHRVGTAQAEDELIYRDTDNPEMNHYTYVTEDEAYLVMMASPGTDGFATYVKRLKNGADWQLLFSGFENKSSVVRHLGKDRFLVLTDIGAPRYRLIEIDARNPAKENWKEIIPESDDLLQDVSTGGGKLFATYLKDATTRIYQLNYDGSDREEIALPSVGTSGGLSGWEEDEVLFYGFTSFVYPPTIFKYDLKTGRSEIFFETPLKFNPEDFVEKQVFYESKDGTKAPLFIVHRKDLVLKGQNPAYLYGYGGFNIPLQPNFSSSRIILLENGGVYAQACLRGGGEYGEEWHRAGMLHNKQNVFDDFIAAAEYLIDEGYTASNKLAIAGGSNGGLLVGACMTQRPDLFAVAFPAVGVLDMLRYHLFTIGRAWIPEYGSSEDPKHFKNLFAYSPLHNLKKGVEYPATMIKTADHDDRVVPAHSFKFAAQLQEVQGGEKPALIRIDVKAGHGAGKPTSKIIEEEADRWAFFFYNTDSRTIY
jgi:prolyl oligopeptidase